MTKINAETIDAILPQTQCRECGYEGCQPYAEAMASGTDAIDRCAPGGLPVLHALAKLLGKDPAPYEQTVTSRYKPPAVVSIREAECIGCTKCLAACPVDAIVGAGKLMHTVIAEQCTGCELCIEPCPMDCIDILPVNRDQAQLQQLAKDSRKRYQKKLAREARVNQQAAKQHQQAIQFGEQDEAKQSRQQAILEAMNRVKAKRQQRDIYISPDSSNPDDPKP